MVRGEQRSFTDLRDEFAFWLTSECEFVFVLADTLRNATLEELPSMQTLQQLRQSKPD